jgi:hypothetical protein
MSYVVFSDTDKTSFVQGLALSFLVDESKLKITHEWGRKFVSKKIIVECNKFNGKINNYKSEIEKFSGISYNKVDDKAVRDIDYEKYNFLHYLSFTFFIERLCTIV